MSRRPQISFVLFREDRERLSALQSEIKRTTGIKLTLAGVLRLVIRVCPLDKSINMKALELLEDDLRGDRTPGHTKRFSRMSCMITPQDEHKIDLIYKLISSVLRSKIKRSALGRLVLRFTDSSLILLHTTREVFFDDFRRRDSEPNRKPRRKAV